MILSFSTRRSLWSPIGSWKKRKYKGKKSTLVDPNVTTYAPAPSADGIIGPTIATLTQEVHDLKAQLDKHGDTLGFVEKVSLDLWSKFKVLFLVAFAPHQTTAATPVPGNVATSAGTAQPTVSQQGQKSANTPSSKRHKKSRERSFWCFYLCF